MAKFSNAREQQGESSCVIACVFWWCGGGWMYVCVMGDWGTAYMHDLIYAFMNGTGMR